MEENTQAVNGIGILRQYQERAQERTPGQTGKAKQDHFVVFGCLDFQLNRGFGSMAADL